MSYFNTTNQTGETLKTYKQKAQSQEQRILELFRSTGMGLTPSDALSSFSPNTPLTSVRRAISNLTNAGLLVKTDRQRMGPYKRPEHVWRLKR